MDTLRLFAPFLIAVGLASLVIHAIFKGMTFTVDETHVRVRFYGRALRRVALSDIEWADRTWVFWNEHYTNTLRTDRIVRLRRRTGLFRNFLISPPDPDAFLANLRRAGVPTR